MKKSFSDGALYLLPAWLFCVLLPVPAIMLWHSDDGVPWRFGCFFIGSATLVASAFQSDLNSTVSEQKGLASNWSDRMTAVSVALLLAVGVFSLLCATMNELDMMAVLKAFYIALMSFCIVPYLTLVHRKPFIAVVFALALVFCMKLLGCVLVVLVYGWNASDLGYTATPWRHPNLLVWLFLLNTTVLSVSFYYAGKRKFRAHYSSPRPHTENVKHT
jgi:hypothetical protein